MGKIYKITFYLFLFGFIFALGFITSGLLLNCNTSISDKYIYELEDSGKRKTEIIQALLAVNSYWNDILEEYNDAYNTLIAGNVELANNKMIEIEKLNEKLTEKMNKVTNLLDDLKKQGYENIQTDYWIK